MNGSPFYPDQRAWIRILAKKYNYDTSRILSLLKSSNSQFEDEETFLTITLLSQSLKEMKFAYNERDIEKEILFLSHQRHFKNMSLIDDEDDRSFTEMDSDQEEVFFDNCDDEDSKDNTLISTQDTTNASQGHPQNQNDAIKIFSTYFQNYCEMNGIKANDGITSFPNFGSYSDIDELMKNPLFSQFLHRLVEFLQSEINEIYRNQAGLFQNLSVKRYYDATVDRILHAINDLIYINNRTEGKQRIHIELDRSFLRFEDGSKVKTKTFYTKRRCALEEFDEEFVYEKVDKSHVLPKKQGVITLLPASNQNDALKLFSSHFQNYLKFEDIPESYPKFYYFKVITETFLKNKIFPKFIKHFANFLQWELGNFSRQTGLYQDLYTRGYYDCTIHRILNTFNHLITIYNHIETCEKCCDFYNFTKNEKKINYIDMSFLKFLKGPRKTTEKTVYSQWVFNIANGSKCEGFNSLTNDNKNMKVSRESKVIHKRK